MDMPDERWVESLFERAMQCGAMLVFQVSRAAYAIERMTHNEAIHRTCHTCKSTIQKHDAKHCLACGELMGDG